MEIARIAVYDKSLWYGDRDEYIAAGYDNVWRNDVYHIMLQGTCHCTYRVVSCASDRMVSVHVMKMLRVFRVHLKNIINNNSAQ